MTTFDDKRKAQEDDYFRKQNEEVTGRLKLKKALDAAGITDDQFRKSLLEAGYDADSARAIYLVPIVDVAWADGRLDGKEIATFKKILRDRGIEENSKAYSMATKWLEGGTDDPKFLAAKELFDPLMAQLRATGANDNKWILEAADLVASATGGVFGFGNKTSEEEQELLNELASKL